MAAPKAQNYANHAYRPVLFLATFFLTVVAIVQFALTAYRSGFSTPSLAALLLSIAVAMAIFMIRNYALALQNRIIRLEMQTRLTRLGRSIDTPGLSLRQVIALRFASDAELPALLDRAVAEQLPPDQIKRAVTDWQGDYMRT